MNPVTGGRLAGCFNSAELTGCIYVESSSKKSATI